MDRRPSGTDDTARVSAEQVHGLAAQVLQERLALGIGGYKYGDGDVVAVLIAAAAQRRSIDSVCTQLGGAPSANLVRQYLSNRLFAVATPDVLEARWEAMLTERLPAALLRQRLSIAIDLTLIPYYGTTVRELDQLRRGEAKAGTTRFHCYATAYVIKDGARLTLALSPVSAHEALSDVLIDLLARLAQRGVRIRQLFLDRGFASVAILRSLHAQPFTTVVALPLRGQPLRRLVARYPGERTVYTMRSADEGQITLPVWIARPDPAARTRRRRETGAPFAVLGRQPCTLSVPKLARSYRRRFGIESRYRQGNQVRPPTCSPDPGLRLLLVAIALLLTNLWVFLKAQLVAATDPAHRAVARAWLDDNFRLDAFRDLLIAATQTLFHVRSALHYPFPLTTHHKIVEY